ncbi:MAG: MerR family transcriptional regulator [Novosphingobium sp.]
MMSEQTHFPGFNDGKAPDALRTIGEVASALGIRQHVLRYWEEQFPMLKPVKRSGGRRYYRPEDVALLATIDRLVHREGYTLRGARQVLESGEALPEVSMAPEQAPAGDISSQLRAIRETLAAALAAS